MQIKWDKHLSDPLHVTNLQRWGDKSLLFAFRWRHHVHSTVVRPFCKTGKIRDTELIYFEDHGPSAFPGFAHGGGTCYIYI